MSRCKIGYLGKNIFGDEFEVVGSDGVFFKLEFDDGEIVENLWSNISRGLIRKTTYNTTFALNRAQERVCTHGYDYVRFSKNLENTKNNCVEWKGAKTRGGYGNFSAWFLDKSSINMIRAHVWSYLYHYGNINPSNIIMHSCDNPSCVNPDHLSQGTFSENTTDMKNKGRASYDVKVCKVTREVALKIRQMGLDPDRTKTYKEIGEMFGLKYSTTSMIINNKRWVE